MKTTPSPARLDRDTPRWPEVRITLGDTPTVTVHGVVTAVDDQATAITRCAAQARALGRPIRATLATADGAQRRVIVTADATVTVLNDAPPGGAGDSAAPHTTRGGRDGMLSRFPAPLRPVIRWTAPVMAVLVAVSLAVLLLHGRQPGADAAGPVPPPPAPPTGQLYTELAPPGWSPNAAWVLPIAPHTTPVTDPGSGVTVAVTTQDRSTPDTAARPINPGDRYLSILEPDGRTRSATPLDDTPRFGPVITHVDGDPVALIATSHQIRYWPLTGGTDTSIDLPPGLGSDAITAAGDSVLITDTDHLGYLHTGTLRTVETLPRTQPGIALDGAVVLTQPDTGTWWTLTADTAPTATRPTPPPGAGTIDRVLAITTGHVLIAWHPTQPAAAGTAPTSIVAAYDRGTGQLLTQTTTDPNSLTPTGPAHEDPTSGLTAAGPITLAVPPAATPTITVTPGLQTTTVHDQIYGTLHHQPVTIDAAGHPTALPPGTLTPVGHTTNHLMVISQNRLYALQPQKAGG